MSDMAAAGAVGMPEGEIEETVAVFAAPDSVTAELVRGSLEAEGIPAVIGEQVAGAYSGAFTLAEGYWGEVRVNPEHEETARALIAGFDAGQNRASDEELTAQAEAASDPRV